MHCPCVYVYWCILYTPICYFPSLKKKHYISSFSILLTLLGKCIFTDMWRIFIYYIQCILVWAVVMGSFIQDLRSLFTLYSVWVVLLHWFSLPFQSSISIYLTETEHSARLPNHKTNVTSVI